MDINELSKVAEIIGGMSGDASAAFSWWVGLQAFEYVVGSVLFLVVVLVARELVKPLISEGRSTVQLRILRDELNVGSTGSSHLFDSDIVSIKDRITRLNSHEDS